MALICSYLTFLEASAVLHLSVSISYCVCGCHAAPVCTNIHACTKDLKCTLKHRHKLSYNSLEQASRKSKTSSQNKAIL